MALIGAFLAALVLQQSIAPAFRADRAAILPADYFPANMYTWCSREAPARTGYWVPDSETIGGLEVALAPALQRAFEQEIKDPSRRPATNEDYRQDIGIRIRGRQVVYINGFHKKYLDLLAATRPELANGWRTRAVNVCDGGSTFFGAEYDPATRQITNIRFNGRGWKCGLTETCSPILMFGGPNVGALETEPGRPARVVSIRR